MVMPIDEDKGIDPNAVTPETETLVMEKIDDEQLLVVKKSCCGHEPQIGSVN